MNIQIQYLEDKATVITWRGAPSQYLEVEASVLAWRGGPKSVEVIDTDECHSWQNIIPEINIRVV